MITEIELAILDWLDKSGLNIKNTDVKKGNSIKYPAAFVFTQTGSFSKSTMNSYRCELGVFVLVAFRDVNSEKKRRHGLYPVLEGIIQGLVLNNLDLEIKPLVPKSFRNVTDKDMREANVLVFEIAFSTSFIFKLTKENTGEELLKIGLNYYLQDPEDDKKADASDEIILEKEET